MSGLKIETGGVGLSIDVFLYSDMYRDIEVYVKHPTFYNTCFTQRVVRFKGAKQIKLLLPFTPKNGVFIVARDYKSKEPVKIVKHKLSHLDTKIRALPKGNKYLNEFIQHAFNFCLRASFLPTGYYNSKNIRIHYVDKLTQKNKDGITVDTNSPARVNSATKIIEGSKDFFAPRTVSGRFAIICHEFAHVYMNNVASSEIEADRNAAMIYLGLGFPRADLINVWADTYKMFDTKQNRNRLNRYMQYVRDFDGM